MQKSVPIPQIQFIDRVVNVLSVVTQRQVPTTEDCVDTGTVLARDS